MSFYRRSNVAGASYFFTVVNERRQRILTDDVSRAALREAIQTLIATAKLNGLEPHAWLKDTLEKQLTWPNSRMDELLPLKQG